MSPSVASKNPWSGTASVPGAEHAAQLVVAHERARLEVAVLVHADRLGDPVDEDPERHDAEDEQDDADHDEDEARLEAPVVRARRGRGGLGVPGRRRAPARRRGGSTGSDPGGGTAPHVGGGAWGAGAWGAGACGAGAWGGTRRDGCGRGRRRRRRGLRRGCGLLGLPPTRGRRSAPRCGRRGLGRRGLGRAWTPARSAVARRRVDRPSPEWPPASAARSTSFPLPGAARMDRRGALSPVGAPDSMPFCRACLTPSRTRPRRSAWRARPAARGTGNGRRRSRSARRPAGHGRPPGPSPD